MSATMPEKKLPKIARLLKMFSVCWFICACLALLGGYVCESIFVPGDNLKTVMYSSFLVGQFAGSIGVLLSWFLVEARLP